MQQAHPVKYIAPTKISRERANEILDSWKAGAQYFSTYAINLALLSTGDIQPNRVQQREWIKRDVAA